MAEITKRGGRVYRRRIQLCRDRLSFIGEMFRGGSNQVVAVEPGLSFLTRGKYAYDFGTRRILLH